MKRLKISSILSTLFLLLVCNIGTSQTKADKINELLKGYEEAGQFNGSALVSQGGKVIHKAGYGMANMEWDIPNAPDTKHRLGSITKQFTAMLIMQLVQEGKVDLKTPITKYAPKYEGVRADEITLHHLMTHTSGIPNYTSFPGFFRDQSRKPYTAEEFLSVFADSTLNFNPGAQYSYSNSGYFLLGYIIEQVTGNSYEDELHSRIFKPLGMKGSGYDHHGEILKNRATGYEREGISYINSPFLDMSIPYAAGSLYSTVEDLFIWDQALYSDKLLSDELKKQMFTNHTEDVGSDYGYGWGVRNVDGEMMVGHGGGINGFNTIISRYLNTNDAVILLNNTGGTDLNKMREGIVAILKGESYELPKKSIARVMFTEIQSSGVAAGLKKYEALKNDADYELNEEEINAMGYQMLMNDQVNEAVALFKFNTERFPDSWNVYDSYAESLMTKGDDAGAIKNYTKSVKMNPANQSGLDFLKKLGVDVSTLVEDVQVDDAVLASYVGKYQLQPGFIIEITKEGSQLKATATGQGTIEIYPKSDTEFYAKVMQADVIFNKNDASEVDSFTLKQGGQVMQVMRME